MEKIIFSAPAKLILTGEHAVVYGFPALGMAINKRLTMTAVFGKNRLNWKIKSEIPSRSGLGSSAALSVCRAALLLYLKTKKINKAVINEIAFNLEKIHHGNPSGIDNTISVYGGLIFYKNKEFKSLKINLPEFLLINSGKPQETTKEMVSLVSKSNNEKILAKIGQLPERFVSVLDSAKFADLITENERLLEELGVVGKKAQKIIQDMEKLGGAAKICGAGGVKIGSGIILVYHKNIKVVKDYCLKNKLNFFAAKLEKEGLRIKND